MSRSSMSPVESRRTSGFTFDRNQIKGMSQNGIASVIVRTKEETKRSRENKKPLEPSSNFVSNGPNRTRNHSSTEVGSDECDIQAYEGVWRRPSPKEVLRKSPSQDSIIVQKQFIVEDSLERSPSSQEEDLIKSTFSNSSTSTVIKRFDNKATVVVDRSTAHDAIGSMNDLPSYELASSAYIKSNLYAQMSNSKSALNSNLALHSSKHAVHSNSNFQPNLSDRSQDSPTTPTSNLPIAVSTTFINQQPRQAHLIRESSLEPIGEEERLVQMTQALMNSQPSRSKRAEVLRFFSAARAFQIRVVAGDIQITDSEGCPLFDAFQELDCRQRWWNIEAYGDKVLLMREELSFGDGSSSWGSRVTITDWNGELFGYLITGDPMRLESAERVNIGRFFSQPAVVNNAACSNVTSVPKACWVCQIGAEDGREQQVARLETYQRLIFIGDGHGSGPGQQHMNFHLKLMALAGIIRLVGALTISPVSDCLALTKFFCNCCAYK